MKPGTKRRLKWSVAIVAFAVVAFWLVPMALLHTALDRQREILEEAATEGRGPLHMLAGAPGTSSIPDLLQDLESPELSTRVRACNALSRVRWGAFAPRVRASLAALVDHHDDKLRLAAVQALSPASGRAELVLIASGLLLRRDRLDPRSVDLMIKVLSDPRAEVRDVAVRALAVLAMGGLPVGQRLAEELTEDLRSPGATQEVIRVLSVLGPSHWGDRGTARLKALAQDPASGVGEAAKSALELWQP